MCNRSFVWLLRSALIAVAALMLPLNTWATVIFTVTNSWRYNQTSNLDAVSWTIAAYNDAAWPQGPGLLYSETNAAISPRNTALTLGRTTYYFRTHFSLGTVAMTDVLTFSNRIDDGAVFYLNGVEVQRVRMPGAPTNIAYATFATGTPSGGDATSWDVFSIPATNAIAGDNVLAVEVHQNSSSSSDILFGAALSIDPVSVTRGPFLQVGTTNSVVVRWRTDAPTDSLVRYGSAVGSLTSVVSLPALSTEHEVTISGLAPETKYFYSVGTSAGVLSGDDTNTFFVTSPPAGAVRNTRIWVVGDAGTKNQNQMNVRDAYYSYTGARRTDLWLMLGDNAYDTGTDAEFQAAVFNMYPTLLRNSVVWPALGNHETAQATTFNDSYPYFSIFTLPTNGVAGGVPSGSEHYYSFDYANIHFVCLDSMTANRATNGAMAAWLRADLDSTTNTWLIAFWHHPPYSKGSHDSDSDSVMTQMRQNFLPILESYGVDLVLSGHSHSYERSFLLDGHYGVSTTLANGMILNSTGGRATNASGPYTKWTADQSHQGAVYVVAGSSGQISGGALNHPAMFISLNRLGSLVLDVDGNKLNAKFLRETGAVDDEFTIVKQDVQFSGLEASGNSLQLSVTNAAAGKGNVVQSSIDLATWVSLQTNIPSSNSFFSTDATTNVVQRFYRILRLP
jgi:hypothetical protein